MNKTISIRTAKGTDLEAVIALDDMGLKENKQVYWQTIFDHYVKSDRQDRVFLVAENNDVPIGFIVGEVRAWEFGSPPCGWVFALTVSRSVREMGIGQQMFDEICKHMKKAGVSTIRTMVDLDDKQTLSFFRSVGLRTGRYIELEKPID